MANKSIFTIIGATIAASLCCVTPVLAVLAGSSSLASSFSWLAPYHNYLVAFTVLVLLYAWYDKLKPSKEIACDCDNQSFWSSKKFLAIVTLFTAVMLTFPMWGSKFFASAPSAESCTSGACDSALSPKRETLKGEDKKLSSIPAKTKSASQTKSNCNTQPFQNALKAPITKEPTNKQALTVFKYMQDEKINPTPYKQLACSGYGRLEIDGLMVDARSKVEEMSPVVLKKMVDNEDEFTLLDVREVAQRAEGEIYADDIMQMTRGDLEFEIMNKMKNKDRVIVTFCRSGGRGLLAAQTLKKMGYENVYTLKGGLKAWARAGYPFDSGLGLIVKVEDE